MDLYFALCACALVSLVASQPMKTNRDNQLITIATFFSDSANDNKSSETRGVVKYKVWRNHRVKRRIISDSKCPVGSIKIGGECFPCYLLEEQDPDICNPQPTTDRPEYIRHPEHPIPSTESSKLPNVLTDNPKISTTRHNVTEYISKIPVVTSPSPTSGGASGNFAPSYLCFVVFIVIIDVVT